PSAPLHGQWRIGVIWDAAGLREYFWIPDSYPQSGWSTSTLYEWQPLAGTMSVVYGAPGEDFQPTNTFFVQFGYPSSLNYSSEACWPVSQIVTSRDGSLTAFGTKKFQAGALRSTLWLADRGTGVVSPRVQLYNGTIEGAAFSPDGRKVAAIAAGRLYVLDVR